MRNPMLSWLRKRLLGHGEPAEAAETPRAQDAPEPDLSSPDPGGMTAAGEPSSSGMPRTETRPGEPSTGVGARGRGTSSSTAEAAPSGSVLERVVEALKGVYDPEIPVSIYELGLIYDIAIDDSGKVDIQMTLTSPNCPEAQSLPPQVEYRLKEISGVSDASVEVVWDPPWGPERMSEAARLELGM